MDVEQILAAFDWERRNLSETGWRREVTPSLVRDVALDGDHSAIAYSHHNRATIDAAIEAQIDYFGRLGHSFEWKVFDHDQPPDLRERLLAHGFAAGTAEAFMALDLQHAPEALLAPVTHDVRRVVSPDELADYRTVSKQAWGEERARSNSEMIADLLRDSPEEIGVYVVYVDDIPASCARASFQTGSRFAGMWGGATVPTFRRQGLYQALVAARVQEARRRGYQFMTIDALPTSRPIVERHGFRFLTYTHPLEWHPTRDGAARS